MIALSVSEPRLAPARASEASLSHVFVVDDDPCARESLELLVRSAGWQATGCASAPEFLDHPQLPVPTCLMLDIDSADLHERLATDRSEASVIFVTDRADVPTTVRAMKRGAVDVLARPLRDDLTLAAIANALEVSRDALSRKAELRALSERYASVTRREREVMARVVAGRLNKQTAAELSITEITVKAHRGMVMRKMKARTLPELVHMALRLGLATPYHG